MSAFPFSNVAAESSVVGSKTGDTLVAASASDALDFPVAWGSREQNFHVRVGAEVMLVVGWDGARTFTVLRGRAATTPRSDIAAGEPFRYLVEFASGGDGRIPVPQPKTEALLVGPPGPPGLPGPPGGPSGPTGATGPPGEAPEGVMVWRGEWAP